MAEQETQERDDAASAAEEDGSTGSTGKDPATSDSATEDSGSGQGTESQETESQETESEPEADRKSATDEKAEQKSAKDEKAERKSAKADEKAEQKSAKADEKAEQKSAKAEQKAEQKAQKSEQQTEEAPARRSENHAKPEQLSEEDRQAQERSRSTYGRGDDEGGRSIDVPELIWKGANVLATVVRAVTLLFAAILVIQIGLSIAAVNPANGFARFVRGFSDTIVLGFRDLFLPADPTVMLIVNYGVAAVFWVLVGVFVSSGLRWVAARIT